MTGTKLLTVTVTDAEAWLPERSNARAVTLCSPPLTVLVSHGTLYGAVVSVPTLMPSTRKSTRLMPLGSTAFAEIAVAPLRIAPFAGAVTDTVGGTVSRMPWQVPVPLSAKAGLPARVSRANCQS